MTSFNRINELLDRIDEFSLVDQIDENIENGNLYKALIYTMIIVIISSILASVYTTCSIIIYYGIMYPQINVFDEFYKYSISIYNICQLDGIGCIHKFK